MNAPTLALHGRSALITAMALAGLVLAARSPMAAEEAARDTNDCVFAGTVHDWRALDSRNLVIWAPGRRTAYHVQLGMPIHDLKSEESLVTVDRNGDGRLCGFGMDQVISTHGAFRQSSTILGMTRLDEAGLAALGEQYKVNLVPPKPGPAQ